MRCIPGESVANARYWLAQSVSPPYGGTSSACRIERERRLGQEREVGVPEAAERVALALLGLAHDRDHLGVIGDRLDERHRAVRTEPAAERDLPVGREVLAAEEDDLVVEDGAADLGDHVVVEVGREVDAADHRAARARERLDGDVTGSACPARRGGHRDQRLDALRVDGHPPSIRTSGDLPTEQVFDIVLPSSPPLLAACPAGGEHVSR